MHSIAHHSQPTVTAAAKRHRLLCVVLIALAWLQFSYASHQFEHAAGDVADSCAVCSHFERLEHSVAPDVGAAVSPESRAVFLPRPLLSVDTHFESHYSPRAPPRV